MIYEIKQGEKAAALFQGWEETRRKGLAHICGAKLILECRKKGWYPSWDAQNLWSVALAEKLGYHFSHAYTAYEIQGKDRIC